MSIGVNLISEERQRQVEEEGYSEDFDAKCKQGVLSMAGVCYAIFAGSSPEIREALRQQTRNDIPPKYWPFPNKYWKPGDADSNQERIRELTKAGALIAAEIDRLNQKD